jgi:two-component system chemotaxis sensor kinase CheA
MIGEDTDLDKNLVEALADPLIHLVRNSVDHGIEMPEERERAKKAKVGKITLAAVQAGDHILLSIEDDGKGMDPNVLRDLAVAKGIINKDVADRLTTSECFELIFIPGFSTKQDVSDISGRGVGMDVVKSKITQLNGSVEIISNKGHGTKMNIKVPLTLAILPTLMVVVGEQTFALPLACVNEIFDLNLDHTNVVDGQLVVIVRNKAMPLFYLKDWLIDDTVLEQTEKSQHVVVVSFGLHKVGFVVDKLLGQEEVVIKALGNMLQGTTGIAGATITGDGKIAVILDVPNLVRQYADTTRKKAWCSGN